jgi:hypothetical protein
VHNVTRGPDFLLRLFTEQKPFISVDSRKLGEDLVRGDFLGCVGADVLTFHKQGVGLHVQEVRYSLGTLLPEFRGRVKVICCGAGKNKEQIDNNLRVGADSVALVNNPPHPSAAKMFINRLLTKEAQAAYFAASSLNKECSARADLQVQCPEINRVEDGKAYIHHDRQSSAPIMNEALELMRRTLGR